MSRFIAGVLIGLATMAGIYAAAATTLATTAQSFTTEETAHHARSVRFASDMKRAAAEFRAAIARCQLAVGAKRKSCNARFDAEERRAMGSASPS